jgi:exosome complex RNA-binding protein Rrp42 (RNase PH superfamily)
LVDESVLRIEDKDEQPKRKAMVWYLYVDIYCLDYDGNVFDACLIALLAALGNGERPPPRPIQAVSRLRFFFFFFFFY